MALDCHAQFIFFVISVARIKRTEHHPLWPLAFLIPLVAYIGLWFFAFKRWPIDDRLRGSRFAGKPHKFLVKPTCLRERRLPAATRLFRVAHHARSRPEELRTTRLNHTDARSVRTAKV